MSTLSFLFWIFVFSADHGRVEICPEEPFQRISCEFYLEAERFLGEREEAVYENKSILLYLFRPAGDFILFVPVPQDVSARLSRFRVYYLARNKVSARWHDSAVRRFGPKERYVVEEAPLPGASEAVDEKTIRMFLNTLKNSKEFIFEHYL